MKPFLFMLLASCFSLSIFGQTEPSYEHICHHEKNIHQKRLEFRASEWTNNYDLVYHKLEWNVDPAVRYIQGVVTSRFVALEDQMQQVHFDFSDSLSVSQVLMNGQQVSFRRADEHILQVDLDAPVGLGELAEVEITYEGIPPTTGIGSFTTSTHNGAPILWTLSEPYGARDWWPCKQDLIDKVDSIDIVVSTVPGNKVASNGVLVDVSESQNSVTYHWRHRHPIAAYLIAIAVTNYVEYSNYVELENGDTLEILNYVYPEDTTNAMIDTKWSVDMMKLFNEKFGLYPYADEKYGHAQFGFGGGIEHQTMSFMGGFGFELQAHELAHQWFGNKVTCGSWQDIWINEGFATYLQGMSIEFLSMPHYWRGWREGTINRIVSEPGGSVYVRDTTDINRIFNGRLSYSKGGYVLHMLRWIMGDDNFFLACRNFLNDPLLAFGYAKTEDFKRHVEMVHGQDMTDFFSDWIYNEGYPSYKIFWTQNDDELVIEVNQSNSHPSVEFFELPLPLHIYSDGTSELVRLDHTEDGQIFRLNWIETVDSVKFDEELWLISTNNTVEEKLGTGYEAIPTDLLEVFPVPFNNTLYLRPSHDDAVSVDIHSIDGVLVFHYTGNNKQEVNTSDWSSGVYTVQLTHDGREYLTKVIKW